MDVHDPAAGIHGITTRDGRPGLSRIDSFENVLAQYETHPEAIALGPDGSSCGRLTKGLLQRRGVVAGHIALIGKEANRLEERASGELTVDDLSQRLTIYRDDDLWERRVLPWIKKLGTRVVAETTGVSERRVRDWLTGQSLPHPRMRLRLRHWLDTNKWDS